MASTEKDTDIKENIFQAAKCLFYEKGYKDTFFSDIANKLGITKGLITYYFSTKSNLANQIYTNFLKSNQNTLSLKTYVKFKDKYSYNPRITTAVSNIATFNMYKDDENAQRFVREFLNDNLQFSIENDDLSLWHIHRRAIDKERFSNLEYMKLISFSARGATGVLQLAYFNGKLNITFDEFMDFYLRLKYQIENLPEEEITRTLSIAKEIYSKLDVVFKPYFVIE